MKILMKTCIGLIALIFIALIAAGIWFFVSFNSSETKDLGVEFTEQDKVRAYEKLGQQTAETGGRTPAEFLENQPTHQVDITMTQEEVSAVFSEHHPVKDFQIKFNDDDSVEASGIVEFDRLEDYLDIFNIDSAEAEAAMDFGERWLADRPFYIKGTGAVHPSNGFTLDIEKFSIGKVPIPLGDNANLAIDTANEGLEETKSGFNLQEARIENGELIFIAEVPNQFPAY